jgi:hypothetical protein
MKDEGNTAKSVTWEVLIPNPDNFSPEEQAEAEQKGDPVLIKVWSNDLDAYHRVIRGSELDAQVAKLATVAEDLRQLNGKPASRDRDVDQIHQPLLPESTHINGPSTPANDVIEAESKPEPTPLARI